MGNISNRNKSPFKIKINTSEFWDFHLYNKQLRGDSFIDDECVSAYIDTNKSECVSDNGLVSVYGYEYEKAVNKGLTLNNIGYTGVDNGFIKYDKNTITNSEFIDLYKNSKYVLEENDKRLHLFKVGGNNRLYDYSLEFVDSDAGRVAKLNGGFFQGFFKHGDKCEYMVLPDVLENEWGFEIELKPEDFENSKSTLNSVNPDSKGVFLYIGTRAENKWYKKYNNTEEEPISECNPLNGDYLITEDENDETELMKETNKKCICNNDDVKYIIPHSSFLSTYNDNQVYFSKDGHLWVENELLSSEKCCKCNKDCSYYYNDGYFKDETLSCLKNYAENDYFKESESIKDNFETKEGIELGDKNTKIIETDNKFLIFDRTPDGLRAEDVEVGEEIIAKIKIEKHELNINPFLYYHRGKGGKKASDYDKEKHIFATKYDVNKDLYENAIGFQIKDDGSVGYKYFVRNCEEGEKDYKIESEFSYPNTVKYGEWNTIFIRIIPTTKASVLNGGKMSIMIYVNNCLVFISKELPMLNLRLLNDSVEKQEGVPYNISLGGGTQGLIDVVYENFLEKPEEQLELSRNFSGSFIGYIKAFKFINCTTTFDKIKNKKQYIYKENR